MSYPELTHIIIGLAVLFQIEAMCQCTTTLSKAGNAHWRAAEALMGMAMTADDYEQVAIELKQVVESDPNYAPVYMKLGKLYTQIGNDKGEAAFDQTVQYYNRCQEVCPDSSDAVVVEMAILNALRRKFANGPNRFVGTWGRYMKVAPYSFIPYVEIIHDGREYIFRPLFSYKESRIDRVEKTETGIIFTYTWQENKETTYQDERDYYADEGYPTSGIYRYNKMVSKGKMFIAIDGDNVVEKSLDRHNDMYLGNRKVYAYTINYHGDPEPLVKQGSKRPTRED